MVQTNQIKIGSKKVSQTDTPSPDEVVTYNSVAQEWQPAPTGTPASMSLSDLNDVTIAAPNPGEYLRKGAGDWVNVPATTVKTDLALTKSDVGLSNVDNTADLDKPVSTATQTALNTKVDTSANSGTGEGTILKAVSGTTITAKSLKQGANITITNNVDDVTIASTGGAGANIKQTEIDFGTTPLSNQTFTVTDADVSGTSQLMAQVAWEAPTSKDIDEIEMDNLQIRCQPGTGQFTMYVETADGSYLADKFKINYLIG